MHLATEHRAEGFDVTKRTRRAVGLSEDTKQRLRTREAADDERVVLEVNLAAVLVVDADDLFAVEVGELLLDHDGVLDLGLALGSEGEVCLLQNEMTEASRQLIHQLGRGLARGTNHLDKEGSGIDRVLAVDMSANGQTARGLAAEDRIVAVNAGGNVLKADRYLVALLTEGLGNAVEQVRRCEVADDRTRPALDTAQIIVKQAENFIGVDVTAVFVDDTGAVAVAVKGDTEVIVTVNDARAEIHQSGRRGSGRAAAKIGVLVVVDQVNGTTERIHDGHQRVSARSVHRVKQNAQTAIADGVLIKAGENVIDERIEGRVPVADQALFHTLGKRERGDLIVIMLGDDLLKTARRFQRCIATLFHDQLDAVVGRGVVACRDLNAVMEFMVLNQEHDQRRGRGALHQNDREAHATQNLGNPFGRGLREETAVTANNDRLIGVSVLTCQKADAVSNAADVGLDEIVTDDAAPAARSKANHVFLIFHVVVSFLEILIGFGDFIITYS